MGYIQPDYRNPITPGVTVGNPPNLDPMNLRDSASVGQAYVQSGVSNPPPVPAAAVPVGRNPLGINAPVARYVQPMSAADDPHGTIAAGKSGKGSAG